MRLASHGRPNSRYDNEIVGEVSPCERSLSPIPAGDEGPSSSGVDLVPNDHQIAGFCSQPAAAALVAFRETIDNYPFG